MTNSWNLQPVHTPPPLPAPPTVTQAEIVQLQHLQAQAREYQRLRKSIVARLLAGEAVEQGRFGVRVDQRLWLWITSAGLVQLWGVERVEQLRQRLPPTTSHHITVTDQSQVGVL